MKVRGFALALGFSGATALAACGSSDEGVSKSTTGGSGGSATGGAAGSGGQAGNAGSVATGGSAGAAGSAATGGSAGAGGSDAGVVDADGDGIDDAKEQQLAEGYFPYFSINPGDNCTRHGVLYRLTPHPADASKIAIWYIVLYENDCGLGGHVGDDEVFGVVIDPAVPAPSGILAIKAISHQGTACEHVGTCGSLPNCGACTTAQRNGKPYPVVFASLNKHGNYADEGSCDLWWCDLNGCALSPAPDSPSFVNAGEPGKPLTNDLSKNGFVNAQNGWTQTALMSFDPWGNTNFGGAGNVTSDLQDLSFVIAPSGC
jgi:hypothetical protein